MTKRIGPKMQQVVDYVARNPGCVMRAAAHHVSPMVNPARNERYGYNTVHRAIRAGLIQAERRGGRYYLSVALALEGVDRA